MPAGRRHPSVVGVARRATLAAAALYLLQGLPVVLFLLYLHGGTWEEEQSIFSVIPYWTGGAYIVGVVLFGLGLVLTPLLSRTWSRRTAFFTAAGATAAYALASFAGIVAGADSADDAIDATMFMLFFVFVSSSVAFACAAAWAWRTRLAANGPAK